MIELSPKIKMLIKSHLTFMPPLTVTTVVIALVGVGVPEVDVLVVVVGVGGVGCAAADVEFATGGGVLGWLSNETMTLAKDMTEFGFITRTQ